MKPCSQVKGFGTNFHGYVLPKYSLFGNVNGVLYVCTSFGYIHTILDKKSKATKTKDFPFGMAIDGQSARPKITHLSSGIL